MGKITKLRSVIKHAWNSFDTLDPNSSTSTLYSDVGPSTTFRPDRTRFRYSNEKTIVTALYVRMAIDIASVPIRHIRVDENKQYKEDMDSLLNNCLQVEANLDQGARQFRQDFVQTLFDEGVVAIVPVDTDLNPLVTGGYDIVSMRVGRILQWYPRHIKVRVYNDHQDKGIREDIILPKNMVAIVENPLYSIMNESNSTLQRLLRKLNLLDAVDEQSASGNLDIIIQLPYVIRTEQRRDEARRRTQEIEAQLRNSQHGIAYADGTEKIVQLNRPSENNLMSQVDYLTKMLYSQLGITEEVMSGTADEPTMINYFNRTVEPILDAFCEALSRAFLTKTARSQGQTVKYFNDPFKLVPVKDLAEIVDKFTRNEVASSNDMRAVIGWRPSTDPKANQLLNKNIPAAYGELPQNGVAPVKPKLPPKTDLLKVPATPQGVNGQNGTGTNKA